MQVVSTVDQVYADDSKRFLLRCVAIVQHAHMQNDDTVICIRLGLKANTHPCVTFVSALVIPG